MDVNKVAVWNLVGPAFDESWLFPDSTPYSAHLGSSSQVLLWLPGSS